MTRDTQSEILDDGYHSLMLAYAAGILDEAQELIVSTHIGLSAVGQKYIRNYEQIGGYFMDQDCAPVPMQKDALDHVLARIDAKQEKAIEPESKTTARCHFFAEFAEDIPMPIRDEYERLCGGKKWSTFLPGIKICDLPIECQKSYARLMMARPGGKLPHHDHKTMEITLVIKGSYSDETGTYESGDLVVTDSGLDHTPRACPDKGCLCLIVTDAPIRLKGLASLLNPFLKK